MSGIDYLTQGFADALGTAAALIVFGLVTVLLGLVADTARRFYADGMAPVPALVRALAYVGVGGPLRLLRRFGAILAAGTGRALGMSRADLPTFRFRRAQITPEVAERVARLRPANA